MRSFLILLTIIFVAGRLWAQAQQADDAAARRQAELSQLPQWQRTVTGENAALAQQLAKRTAEAEAGDDYPAAIKSAEELLTLRNKLQGRDHHEAISQGHVVAALRKVADLDAMNRQGWRMAMNSQSEALRLEANAQYALALLAKQQIMKRRLEVLGEEHPDTATSYNSVAFNLNAQGRIAEAATHYQKALEINRSILGEEHPQTATSYNNLGANLAAQGKVAEAAAHFEKALQIRRRALGENTSLTATSYNNVGYSLQSQGKFAAADRNFQAALEINLRVNGENNVNTAGSYNNLATNLNAQGKVFEAAPHFQQALEITRLQLGENHPTTAMCLNNVAMNLQYQGKLVEAQTILQQCLVIRRRFLSEDHPDVARSYANLAANLHEQGQFTEAAVLSQRALELRLQTLGYDHPDSAESFNSVGLDLLAQGKQSEAAICFETALSIRQQVLGLDHPETAKSYSNVAMVRLREGKTEEAEQLFRRALEISKRVFGDAHDDTARVYHNLASTLNVASKHVAASSMLQQALEINLRVLGDNHPDTAAIYGGIGFNLAIQAKAADATDAFTKCLDIRRRILGEAHSDTALSYNNLALNLVARGNVAEAESVLRNAIFSFESSRLMGAQGIERASLGQTNPRRLLATLIQGRSPGGAWLEVEHSLARGLLDQQSAESLPVDLADVTGSQRDQELIATVQPQIVKLATRKHREVSEEAQLAELILMRGEAENRQAARAVAESTKRVAKFDQVQASLQADAALLLWVDEYSKPGDVEEHWACVVRSEGDPKWERLPGAGTGGKWTEGDAAVAAKFRAALTHSAAQAEVDALARRLQSQRIAPILKHLDGVTTLYVVGVDAMAGIPVEAITDNYTISYVPSATFLARRGKSIAKPASMLVLGDPSIPAKQETGQSNSLPPGGLLIQQVVPGGPAAKALLKPNDVLVTYAGTKIESIEQLSQVISDKASEKAVPIDIWRQPDDKLATYKIESGRLGVVLAKEPAREAIAARRKAGQLLASVARGGVWGELPGTQVEVSELTKFFEPGSITVLTRSKASEPALEQLRKQEGLSKFRYLHFATHGEANNVRAFDSKLILAQDHPKQLLSEPGEPLLNNELSAREVLNHWKLDAELVTLSACETALGKNAGGDGMLGFSQAFLLAGSHSVCLSLWKVEDTATALLMDRFYRNMLGKREDGAKPLGKAAALHEAKTWLKNLTLAEATDRLGAVTDDVSRGSKKGREVIGEIPASTGSSDSKPYSHPKFWAAFILIGDPG